MRRKCDMPFKMLKIQMNGDVFACSQGQPVTNLFRTDPLDIWNSPRMLELRAQLDTGSYDAMCKKCPLVQDFGEEQPSTSELLNRLRAYKSVDGRLVDEIGNVVPTTTNAIGWVDDIAKQGNTKTIQGWAVNTSTSLPASAIIVVVDGKISDVVECSVERQDVAVALKNSEVTQCGFNITATISKAESIVQIFASDECGSLRELQFAN